MKMRKKTKVMRLTLEEMQIIRKARKHGRKEAHTELKKAMRKIYR